MALRILAAVLFALAILMAFGWLVSEDTARAVGLVAAGMLACVLSTIPVGPVP
jgi:hypothetical protein